jgi:hypothetical protein
MKTKICNKCKEEKEVCEFYKNIYSKDKLRSNCKVCQNKNSTNWRLNNIEKYKDIQKKFIENNPGISYEYSKKWNNKNKDRVRNYQSEYSKNRYNQDILFKLKTNYRNRLKDIFRDYGYVKNNRSIDYLGCDIKFLKEYLESKFTDGMTWDNKGFYGWHIDHIIPLSSAKTEEEVYKLCHYTNLQPLWSKDNMSKGSKLL